METKTIGKSLISRVISCRRVSVLVIVALLLGVYGKVAHALPLDLRGVTVTETNMLGVSGDDEVRVEGRNGTLFDPAGFAVPMFPGDIATWEYYYRQGGPAYKVIIGEKADLNGLALRASSTPGGGAANVVSLSIQLLGWDGEPVGQRASFVRRKWNLANLIIGKQNDVFGILGGDAIIAGFRIRIRHLGVNPISFVGGNFEWEDRQLDRGSCPEVACLGESPTSDCTVNGIPNQPCIATSNSTIIGTNGDDVILGLDGNDVIFGRGGNDLICGGPGIDILDGGDDEDLCVDGEDIRDCQEAQDANIVFGFIGDAHGIGAGDGFVRLRGRFTVDGDLNLANPDATVQINSLLTEPEGIGEAVQTLPISLIRRFGGDRVAVFEVEPGTQPPFGRIRIDKQGENVYDFCIEASLTLISPLTQCSMPELLSRFTIDDKGNSLVVVTTTQRWECFNANRNARSPNRFTSVPGCL